MAYDKKCPKCGGKGEVKCHDPKVSKQECPKCRGTGWKTCDKCNGTGRV